MLIVKNNNESEFLFESNYEKFEVQNGNALQISFDSYDFEKNVGYRLLDSNVIIEDEDGNEYKVKQITRTPNSKSVVATHIYYELSGFRKYEDYSGNRTFLGFVDWLFIGSGWRYNIVDVEGSYNFNSFGNDNFIQLIQRLITAFDCEFQILPNKIINFAKRIGEDNDKQYRFKSNIESISQNIDTTNIKTRIFAYGENGLTASYTSPLAQNPLFGILDADPITDNSITDYNELLELARTSLNDVPETSIEVSVLNTDGNVGDYVWIIHEKLNLQYQARILSKRTKREYKESEVEIGNTRKRTIEDAIIDQKIEVKENAEMTKKELKTLEEKTEEDLAIITDGLTELRFDVRNTENTLRSEIIQTASRIELRVNDNETRIAEVDIRADRIQANVINLENSTNSSITQLSNNINLKVDVGGTISDINLSQGAATINADKINLNGAVVVDGSISGSTDITVNRNAAVGNALYFGGYQGSFDFIEISGGDMSFNSFGDFVFSGGQMYLNGLRVLTTADL